MRIWWIAGVLLLAWISPLRADDTSEAKQEASSEVEQTSPEEQYQAMVREFDEANQRLARDYRAATTDEERRKILAKRPQPEEFAKRLLELAKKHPDSPAALDAQVWVVSRLPYSRESREILKQLREKHIENENLAAVCQSLGRIDSPASEEFLRAAIEKNPHREVKGQATFALATLLSNRMLFRPNTGENNQAEEVERLLDQVVTEYGDLPHYGGTLKDVAERQLFEIRYLAIGKVAPEIEGEDIDGQQFKLSDYRGKVVVLDFWGHW